jgi:hypothetical protein
MSKVAAFLLFAVHRGMIWPVPVLVSDEINQREERQERRVSAGNRSFSK